MSGAMRKKTKLRSRDKIMFNTEIVQERVSMLFKQLTDSGEEGRKAIISDSEQRESGRQDD